MKQIPYIIPALALLLSAACSRQTEPVLRTGDLLFVGLPWDYRADSTDMGGAIVEATGSDSINFIHTAIVETRGDSTWIIDATLKRGVARYPLDTFLVDFTLRDGSSPSFVVMRLKDSPKVADYVENAKKFIGLPYDSTFMPGNGAMYCTELVRESYRRDDGSCIFGDKPMNFKNLEGEFPAYWVKLFASLGMPIPQGVPGTNPQDMAKETVLTRVGVGLPRQSKQHR